MAIIKPPKLNDPNDFLTGAPDGKKTFKRKKKDEKDCKTQISITVNPYLLERIMEYTSELEMTRSSFFNLAAKQLLDRGLEIKGQKKE